MKKSIYWEKPLVQIMKWTNLPPSRMTEKAKATPFDWHYGIIRETESIVGLPVVDGWSIGWSKYLTTKPITTIQKWCSKDAKIGGSWAGASGL